MTDSTTANGRAVVKMGQILVCPWPDRPKSVPPLMAEKDESSEDKTSQSALDLHGAGHRLRAVVVSDRADRNGKLLEDRDDQHQRGRERRRLYGPFEIGSRDSRSGRGSRFGSAPLPRPTGDESSESDLQIRTQRGEREVSGRDRKREGSLAQAQRAWGAA